MCFFCSCCNAAAADRLFRTAEPLFGADERPQRAVQRIFGYVFPIARYVERIIAIRCTPCRGSFRTASADLPPEGAVPPCYMPRCCRTQYAHLPTSYHNVQKIAAKKLRLIIFYTSALNSGAAGGDDRRYGAEAGSSPGHYSIFWPEKGRGRRTGGHLRAHYGP